jgi:5-methylcytosine-specific restriction enzyme subunit McrC
MHALARFFLEQAGPTHEVGGRQMVPFLVDMARLFELFVAEWLREHLPANLILHTQHTLYLDDARRLPFRIDLLVKDASTGAPQIVLDTKYKAAEYPSSEDVQQIVAYAQAKGCKDAVLVYPSAAAQPLRGSASDIRVRSLAFALDRDLETAGNRFLEDLLS